MCRLDCSVLKKVKDTFGVPIITDIHEPHQAEAVGKVNLLLMARAVLVFASGRGCAVCWCHRCALNVRVVAAQCMASLPSPIC